MDAERMPPPLWSLQVGDALHLASQLRHASVDALVADPPYASGGATRSGRNCPTSRKYVQTGDTPAGADFPGDHRDQRALQAWLALLLVRVEPALKPGALVALFADWRNLACAIDAVQVAGLTYRGLVVWDKTVACRPQKPFRQQAEFVVVATHGANRWTAVLPGVVSCRSKHRHHITEKPVPVMQHLLRALPRGATVLDMCAGSGSTGVAALSLGLRFIGWEKVPAIAEVARKRLHEAQGALPL